MKTISKPLKIFIVDDDPLALEMMRDTLQTDSDYKTRLFSTGEDCLKEIGEQPDAVILDYHLNEKKKDAMNGLEVLQKIKIHDYKIPVIILSSQESYSVAAQTIAKGAIHYIIKDNKSFEKIRDLLKDMLQ